MRRSAIFLLLVLSLVSVGSGQTGWTPEMQLKTKTIGSTAISPDGTMVLYTVSYEVMTADKSEYVSQIWLASANGRRNTQITFADKSSRRE